MNMKRTKKVTAGLDVLPDEILITILSRLILKEAVRTSVFSRRWRYLWRFTSGNLEFDSCDISRWNEGVEFERCVNQILQSHQSPSIDKLFVRVPVMPSYPPVDHWISFAMQKNVNILQLDLSKINPYALDLEKFLFLSVTTSPGKLLCYLKSVQLVNVDVNDELIEYIVSHAPRIENISLKLSHHVENLKVVGSSLKFVKILRCPLLKSLKVVCPSLISLKVWKCSKLKSLEVLAENMVSLKYNGRKLRRNFEDAHLLPQVELHLGGYYCKRIVSDSVEINRHHSSWMGRLEKLNLHVPPRFIKEHMWPVGYLPGFGPSPFPNLKHLELHVKSYTSQPLHFIQQLAGGCPFLSSLVIKLCYLWTWRTDDTISKGYFFGSLKCLKVVKIINFAGLRADFNLAMQLLRYAKRLDKMVIRLSASPKTSLSDARNEAMRLVLFASNKLVLL